MKITNPEHWIKQPIFQQTFRNSGIDLLEWAGLAAVVLLAGLLRFDNLARLGYVNHYYSAAMVSMLKSWHNFFFLAAEPGGAVSVDKPPVGLWIQAASTVIFGVNPLGVLLPEILAGLASIIVLYHLVRRSFGVAAGLIAALALALTPIVIATDRNNTIDSLLILTLLLAAWAFIKATEGGFGAETKPFLFLLLGAALMGVGFNIKMLEAFLPLPAFYGLYLLESRAGFWRKVVNLFLATLLLIGISLSWVTIVDLTPTNQRPYIGSSGDNTETSLIMGYNGMDRLLGMFGRGRSGQSGGFPARLFQGGAPNNGRAPGFNPGSPQNGGLSIQAGNSGTPSGSVNMGQTGILRLFLPPLSKNASWLLPFGILGAILLLVKGVIARWSFKRNKPIKAEDLELDEAVSPEISALILWGGWLITGMAFFSIAQFFHEYYLSILGPPLAALVGIGAVQFWDLRKQSRWLTATLFITSIGGTIAYQLLTARLYISSVYWLPIALPLFGIGAVLWIATSPSNRLLQAGFTCLIAAMFVAPSLWSILTNAYPSENRSLPSVYSGQTGLAADQRGLNVNPKLLDYLESNTQSGSYLLAVPSSMQGSDYVIATGRPVLYLGGFMGIDQVVTTDQLAQRVQQGQLRFIYASGQRGGMGMGSQAKIFTWVSANCSVVPSFDAVTQNSGAPGGIGGSGNPAVSGSSRGFGSMQVSLYDCGSPN